MTEGSAAICLCYPGYHAAGLDCLADADVDTDVDGDSDVDEGSDGDAVADAALDACAPDCTARECGPDPVCGELCGPGCGSGELCSLEGRCAIGAAGTWVAVAACAFTMGSPVGEVGRSEDEIEHSVTLTRGFEVLATEVTQGELEALMGYNPSSAVACGATCPVENLNWNEAAAYCNALSDASGLGRCYDCAGSGSTVTCTPAAAHGRPYDCPGYRLPTEAEWELAARAGTTTATYNGDLLGTSCPNAVLDPIAWTTCNAAGSTHPVGSLVPTPTGLLDVFGNVWEWCHDWYVDDLGVAAVTDPVGPATGSARVRRGSSWGYGPSGARAASRAWLGPGSRLAGVGFRPVRSLP